VEAKAAPAAAHPGHAEHQAAVERGAAVAALAAVLVVGREVDARAAAQRGAAGGRLVRYVMTKAGPEPVGATTAPPDYEHYVTQQLRPIADAMLRFLDGPDFDDLIGARKQLSLFPERRGA
jgi:DNA polymerase elongation subunit (family B)